MHDEFTASDEASSFVQLAMANFYNDEVRFELVEQTVIVEDTLWILFDSQEPKAKVWLGSLNDGSVCDDVTLPPRRVRDFPNNPL